MRAFTEIQKSQKSALLKKTQDSELVKKDVVPFRLEKNIRERLHGNPFFRRAFCLIGFGLWSGLFFLRKLRIGFFFKKIWVFACEALIWMLVVV